MNASEPLPVLVGADGSMSGLRAVRYAALAASSIAVPLDIVHVTPSYLPMPPVRPVGAYTVRGENGEIVVDLP